MEGTMNKDKGPKKSIYYYYMLALAILLLLNTVIIPMFFSPKVQEISYSSFLQMVDEGKVDKVEITNNKIARKQRNRWVWKPWKHNVIGYKV